jgi:DNA-binding GntR family transcriptional regulator
MPAKEGPVSADVALSAAEQVVALLREQILNGQLPGGAPVREQDVAAQLGLSRTPVREAVGRLVAEGLLIKDGNKTAHVFRPSLAELLEIYEIRAPLESMAARLTCEAADKDFVRDLERAGKALENAEPGMAWSRQHEAFHLLLARGGGRRRLELMVTMLRVQSEPYVRFAVAGDHQFPQRAQHDHEEIVRLVASGDGKGLERLVRNHLLATSKQVSNLLAQAASAPTASHLSRRSAGRSR